MDSGDLEKERGITISSKNASLHYGDTKINLVDTPGHADFGGEVERIMNMVDGAILLVDASEGPLPQTRFVVEKAIEKDLNIVVCINKIDRDDARVSEVVDEVFELFMELGASDEQLDFPLVYSVAIEGKAMPNPDNHADNLKYLFEQVIDHIPAPDVDEEKPLQMLVSNLSYSDYLGRLAIGRVRQGRVSTGNEVLLDQSDGQQTARVQALFGFDGLEQVEVDSLPAGEIAVVAGFENVKIGDSLTDPQHPDPLPRIEVEEPTVGITIHVNDGPFSGRDGEHVTGTKLYERLQQEDRNNVAIRLEEQPQPDRWKLLGRGELQLAVLLEEMRRDGYEMLVSKPEVLMKEKKGQTIEPVERVVIDIPETFVGAVTEKLGGRQGEMESYESIGSERVRLEFTIPTRGLIGYRSEFLTDTRGTGLLNSHVTGYEPFQGEIDQRHTGALIADRQGEARAYAIHNLEERGTLFIEPGTACYQGMIVGEHNKAPSLDVNITKHKQLTNFRAAGSDDAIQLTPVKEMTIERALEWITDDELIEITPKEIRLRCRELDPNNRST